MADLVMPKLGLTMTEGLLSEWHVSTGAQVQAGDILFTVETEKVANEVEAEQDGEIGEILVLAGETVSVGTPVARLSTKGADDTQSPAPLAGTETSDGPAARKLMAEHDVARDDIPATGRDGRVTKEDVMRVIATPLARRIASNAALELHQIEGSGPKGRIKARDVKNALDEKPAADTFTGAPVSAPANAPAGSSQEIVPDATRVATARRVTGAKRDIPHFYLTHEAEISALSDLRAQLNADETRPRISVTHMLIRALGLTLAEYPEFNRIWSNDRILAFDRADIGMIAETPEGLRIPVIRDAGGATLDRVAELARDLGARARNGDLGPGDVGDGVIAISNVGMFGVTSLTPIINPPNAMILGVGAERAVFRPDADEAPELRRELTFTLACDHRVIDGAAAARFLSCFVQVLETPLRLMRPAQIPA